MSFALDAKRRNSLQLNYFTKEFPGYEIESKWELQGQTPVPTMLQFIEDINKKKWKPFKIQLVMGFLPVGLRYFEYEFYFFGVKIDGVLKQIAMAAKFPGKELYLVAFKNNGDILRSKNVPLNHNPLIRKETRKGDWIPKGEMWGQLQDREPMVQFTGKMSRQKCSIYITSTKTYRNFNISADLCYSINRLPLSQVEIEYKGRSGSWLPDCNGDEILKDFKQLHLALETYSFIRPTFQSKFDWITNNEIKI